MNFAITLTEDLEKLIVIEPNLLHDLRTARSVCDAIERVKTVAGRHGIALDLDALTAFLRTGKTKTPRGELNDEQLAGMVSAGIWFPFPVTLPTPRRPRT